MIGQTISHYRITEKLGEGGMGLVYKAEDTKLGRTVALKFLRTDTLDDEHRARFLREAQAAASLMHPNICTVFEIDEFEGAPFLAMEYVEGRSLKNKIAERPLKLDEALDVAIQTAQALDAAHREGIVHRDIKSANLMVTPEGQVKVTDFGLAQLAGRTRVTETGARLGTPAYMSPEQTRGDTVDRRTDIWSLGVVLYEMISGRLPFKGDVEAAVARAILDDEPEPLTALRTGLPVELDRILAKLLAKAADDRYQHASEVVVDLRPLQHHTGLAPPRRGITRRRAAYVAGGAVAAAVGVGTWLWRSAGPRRPAPVVNLTIPIPQGAVMADSGRLLGPPVVAPDGSAVVVALRSGISQQLFIRRLDANRLVPMQGTDDASYPFWSPDSRHVGFFADVKLKRIPASGGTAVVLCDAPRNRGGAWGAEGAIIFGVNQQGLFRVSENGGESIEFTHLDEAAGENSHRYPVFLPDGNRFLYFARTNDLDKRGIYLDSLDRAQPRRRVVVADGQFAIAEVPRTSGWFLLTQQVGRIVAQPFDMDQGRVIEESHVLVDHAGQVSASATGVLAVRPEQQDLARLVWYDRTGREGGEIGEPTDYWQVELSPDDRTLAVVKHDYLSGYFGVWLASLPQGLLEPFSDSTRAWSPVFSPDSHVLYYVDYRARKILRRRITPRGPEELFMETDEMLQTRDLSSDRRFLTADELAPDIVHRRAAWTEFGQNQWHLVNPAAPLSEHPRFSPDGRWLAYASNQTGASEVYVRGFPEGPTHRVSASGGIQPRWRSDGRELFYVANDGYLTAVEVADKTSFDFGQPQPLFQPRLRGDEGPHYDVQSDGGRFIAITSLQSESPPGIEMILNWPGLLSQAQRAASSMSRTRNTKESTKKEKTTMPIKSTAIRTLAILVALGGIWTAFTQQQAGRTEEPLRIEKIQDDLHVIFGPGGNIGVLITDEGVILVDDKFDRHAEQILAQVKKVTAQPVRYILNTHHHGDHTGANQKLSAAADILMHENARKNLIEKSQPGLPRMTFKESASIFLGGKEVRAHHFSRGHTDGDAVIEFVGTGVIHMGDMFVEGGPFIDYSSGASAVEWDKTLAGALSLNFDRVIRGHGPIGARSDIELWRKQFSTVRERMQQLTRSTSSAQEAAKQIKLDDLPGWGLDGRLGRGVEGLYQEMSD